MNAISDIQAGQGLTRALAEQARALRLEDIPETIRTWARQCVLDTIGCGVGPCGSAAGGVRCDRQRRGGACAGFR